MKKHLMYKSPEYLAWANVIKRCYNPRHAAYKNYGGRGIFMDEAWRYDFASFYKHIGPRPGGAYELDRIDNNLGYHPGNVRWVTRKENSNNMRKTVFLIYKNKKYALTALAEISGIPSETLRSRIDYGWPVKLAVETPSGAIHCRDAKERSRKQTRVWVEIGDLRVSFSEACRMHNVAIDTAWRRLNRYNWTLLQSVGAEKRNPK